VTGRRIANPATLELTALVRLVRRLVKMGVLALVMEPVLVRQGLLGRLVAVRPARHKHWPALGLQLAIAMAHQPANQDTLEQTVPV